MTEVAALQSIAERLTKIAGDCFDLRAAQRLQDLASELRGEAQAPPMASGSLSAGGQTNHS